MGTSTWWVGSTTTTTVAKLEVMRPARQQHCLSEVHFCWLAFFTHIPLFPRANQHFHFYVFFSFLLRH
jgi:hypothetical protein